MPKRSFKYLVFYQPALFGRRGKRILYYARVLSHQIIKRSVLLPDEPNHPGTDNYYFRFRVGGIKKLSRPIKNIIPRRVSFGFTSLNRLLKSKNILDIYDIAPTEQIIEKELRKKKISAIPQYRLSFYSKRYCLDFAVFCKNGTIAIECDNKNAHSGRSRVIKDKIKDTVLKQNGWVVLRLTERKILSDLDGCVQMIKRTIRKLGGLK